MVSLVENLFRVGKKEQLLGGLDDASMTNWIGATSEVMNREPTGVALRDLMKSIQSYRSVSRWLFVLMMTLIVIILALGIGLGVRHNDEGKETFILGYALTGLMLLSYLLFVIWSFEHNNFIKRQILSSIKLSVPAMSKCIRQYEALDKFGDRRFRGE